MNLEYNDIKSKHDASTEDAVKNQAEILRLNMFLEGWYDFFINKHFQHFCNFSNLFLLLNKKMK